MAVAPEMGQYLEAFLIEATEEVSRLQAFLEGQRREGIRLALIEEAARAMANLKSAASTMGFTPIRDLAHAASDMLNAWRRGGVNNPRLSVELLIKAQAHLSGMVRGLSEGGAADPSPGDLMVQMRAMVTDEGENPWPETEIPKAKGPVSQRFIIRLVLEPPCPQPAGRFLVCQGYLLSLGEVLAADPPPPADETEGEVAVRFLLATECTLAEIKRAIGSIPHVIKLEIDPTTPETSNLPPARSTRKRPASQNWMVHLEARYLEDLDETIGELSRIRSSYHALVREVQTSHPNLGFRFSRLGERLDYPLRQLTEFASEIRKIPADFLFAKLIGFVHERAKALEKEIEVKTSGSEAVLSAEQGEELLSWLQDALGFLLEKSGESPAERLAAGKSRLNHVEIAVAQAGAKTTINLSDDGKGIEIEPEMAGDGGLAVLRRELSMKGAAIDGQSWPGQGTLLTIEIVPDGEHYSVLAVEIAGDCYALPLQAVTEARKASDEMAAHIDGRMYLPESKEMIPIHDLASILGKPSEGKGGYWLILRNDDLHCILRVPVILGPRQVWPKGSPATLPIAGLDCACVDGGGKVYLLLSMDHLAKIASKVDRLAAKAGGRP